MKKTYVQLFLEQKNNNNINNVNKSVKINEKIEIKSKL